MGNSLRKIINKSLVQSSIDTPEFRFETNKKYLVKVVGIESCTEIDFTYSVNGIPYRYKGVIGSYTGPNGTSTVQSHLARNAKNELIRLVEDRLVYVWFDESGQIIKMRVCDTGKDACMDMINLAGSVVIATNPEHRRNSLSIIGRKRSKAKKSKIYEAS